MMSRQHSRQNLVMMWSNKYWFVPMLCFAGFCSLVKNQISLTFFCMNADYVIKFDLIDWQTMTDVVGNPEEERRADFFYQPWSQEAVCRYFYGKVSFWCWAGCVTHFQVLSAYHTGGLACLCFFNENAAKLDGNIAWGQWLLPAATLDANFWITRCTPKACQPAKLAD